MGNNQNLAKLFSSKGLRASVIVIIVAFCVGFVAGIIVEQVKGVTGERYLAVQLSLPVIFGLIFCVGTYLYFVYLLAFKKAKKTKPYPV